MKTIEVITHTAGPWEAKDFTFGGKRAQIAIGPVGIGRGKSPVASINGFMSKALKGQEREKVVPSETMWANAKLIAAAPEMLELLIRIYKDEIVPSKEMEQVIEKAGGKI